MAPEVQFLAITAFLIWGLVSSVCGHFVVGSEPVPVPPDQWEVALDAA